MHLNLFLAAYTAGNEKNPKLVIIDGWKGKELYNGTYHSLAINLENYDWISRTVHSWDLEDNILTIEII